MYLHLILWYPLTPLSPTPSKFSAMRTPDVQTPRSSASIVDTDETKEEEEKKIERKHEAPNQQLKEIHKCNTLASCTGEV